MRDGRLNDKQPAGFLLHTSLIALAVFLYASSDGNAQTWPNRSIRIVVPWAAGGPPDAVARVLGQRLGEAFKQQVVIDNRPGANSIIGTENVARAAPDGYTWLITTGSHTQNAALYPKLPYDTLKDFLALTLIGESAGMVVTVHPSLPVKSVKELIALAKARPGELNYTSGGNGSPGHLIAEMFKAMTATNIIHVPYKTVAQGVTGLIAGQAQVMFTVGPSAVPQIKSGRIRGVAVTTLKRSNSLPDLPTVAESGLPGFEAPAWNGVLVPAGTPQPVIAKIHAEILKNLKQPDVLEKIGALGFEPVGSTPAEFGDFVKAELLKWAKVSKDSGAKAE